MTKDTPTTVRVREEKISAFTQDQLDAAQKAITADAAIPKESVQLERKA